MNWKRGQVEGYLKELVEAIAALSREEIVAVIDELLRAWSDDAQAFLMGNGGSAATASHMANDLNKLTIVPGQPRFRVMALTDNAPLMTAWGNDNSYEDIFAEQLLNFVRPGDVVVGISCSGNSANVLKALRLAREMGAVTIGFTGQDGGQLKHLVDHCVFAPTEHFGRQEDIHVILNHVISSTLREMIERKARRLDGNDGG